MQEPRHETANEILAAAQDLFYEKGYEKTTTRELAERVGISKAAVYHHFENKEEILYTICLKASYELIGNMRLAIERNISADVPVPEQIKDIILEYARTYIKNKNFNKILLYEIEFLPMDKKRVILDKETENFHQLRSYLRGLIDEGKIKSFNSTVLTFSLLGTLHWLFFWFKPHKGLSLEEVIDQFVEIHLYGMIKE
jgi:AcrR family transcriptional regulator